ncbi:hypothetical protein ACSAZL_07365 [Methanosarcina sp. T3]|uniref:hypothetical protein n=1 Tax=Methanosarcina sp. T3 TaxID=3439062 RepID=UPI003F84DB94
MTCSAYIMTIIYPDIKPWSRSFEEYAGMFSLTPAISSEKFWVAGTALQALTQNLRSAAEISYPSTLFTLSALTRSERGSGKPVITY